MVLLLIPIFFSKNKINIPKILDISFLTTWTGSKISERWGNEDKMKINNLLMTT